MSDPDALPGMAHLCEHMLFLGTDKVCVWLMIDHMLELCTMLPQCDKVTLLSVCFLHPLCVWYNCNLYKLYETG